MMMRLLPPRVPLFASQRCSSPVISTVLDTCPFHNTCPFRLSAVLDIARVGHIHGAVANCLALLDDAVTSLSLLQEQPQLQPSGSGSENDILAVVSEVARNPVTLPAVRRQGRGCPESAQKAGQHE
eukprot:1049597-Prorocentrum_minimum.AAC.2